MARPRLLVGLLAALGMITAGALSHPVGASPVPAQCRAQVATIVGTPGPDLLVGTPGRDVIVGLGGHDVIRGRGGSDVICGGPGHDVLMGGPGDDVLRGGGGRDDLIGGPGFDLLAGGRGADALVGRHGDDVLLGGPKSDLLLGGAGDDELRGGLGRDTASFLFAPGGVSADLAAGTASGEGADTVTGIEHLVGSPFDDSLTGDEGFNRLESGDGDDVLAGGGGRDALAGGPGDDLLLGGDGTDGASFLTAGEGVVADLATGTAMGQGLDVLVGMDNVTGSSFDDHLAGDEGPNHLTGHFGADLLEGRGGDDSLDGGWSGSNTVDGGPGDDDCTNGQPIDCESVSVIDPAFFSWITRPRHGAVREELPRIAGVASTALGPPVTGAEVALRRITPSGCRWWDHDRGRLVIRPCNHPLWTEARWGGGRWRLRIDAELPDGHYQARSRVLQGGDRQRHFSEGWNVVEFRLT